MATVYVGRLRGAAGFWRLCAIKRAHRHLVDDASFRRMFVAEARLASKLHHPNVVAVEDVEELGGELRLIMDYVEGASLSELLVRGREQNRPLPARAAVRIALDAAAGLHAAHQLADDSGRPLRLVHRDVSPQNILVGIDGTSRLADFGIAKSAKSSMSTTTGAIKGKVGYMAPEYIEGNDPDARSDVFGLAVVVWEALTHQKLFRGHNEIETLKRVVGTPAPPLGSLVPAAGHLDDALAIALEKSPAARFDTAAAFGAALETAARRADLLGTHAEVAAEVRALFSETLEARRAKIRAHVHPLEDDLEEPPDDPVATASLEIAEPASQAPAAAPPARAISTDRDTATTFGASTASRALLDEPIGSVAGVPRRTRPGPLVLAGALLAGAVAAVAFTLLRSPAPPEAAPASPEPNAPSSTIATAPPTIPPPATGAPAPSTSAAPEPAGPPLKRATSPLPPPTLAKPPAPAPPAETVAPNPYAKPTR